MLRPLSSILIFALLVAQVLPLGSVARGAVLCVSLDGHVAIEPAHAASGCDDLCGTASEEDHDEDGCDEDDHGCFDLQLGDLAVPLESARTVDDGAIALVFNRPAVEMTSIALDAAGSCRGPDTARVYRGRCALRTVVLRL